MRRLTPMLGFLAALAAPLQAQEACTRDAMVVFDASGSMAEMGFNRLNEPRIFEARHAMEKVMPRVEAARKIGLMTYGAAPAGNCTAVDMHFLPRPMAGDAVTSTINAIQPEGETPLTDAVRMAADVFGATGEPGIVVLVTDGNDTCGGDPCALADQLVRDQPGLTVHVIGFRVRGSHFVWPGEEDAQYERAQSKARCLAHKTAGHYAPAESLQELVAALQITLGCSVYGSLPQASSRRRG